MTDNPLQIVEFREAEQLRAWQDFHLSKMPELISSMHLCQAVFAMLDSGLLQRLRNGQHRTEDGLLDDLDERMGPGFLQYLTIRGVLEQRDGGVHLTRWGELLTSDVSLARLGIYVGAYGPVTSRMSDLLTGRVRYGEDVNRNGGPLGAHCATLFSIFHTPVVLRAMQGRDVTCVLDVGCGGGQLLVDACLRDKSLRGVGLDISPEAVEVARDLARREGVDDRVEFMVADGFAPETWPEAAFKADGLCAVSALHEHFRDGEQAVVDILDTYARVLPEQKILLVGEPEMLYVDNENHDDFFLVHLLSGQGLPRDRSAWLAVFEKTALECRLIYTRPGAGPRICFYDLAPRRC
ncbi:SAM-dependent methyltransferase [Micromonospora sp. NPDC049051]|uniref:SAM-dependent methyltransferase n=1 Tax=unclassified Micromonospora TaxID=2617518 RepID=UPI00371B11CC